MRNRIWKTGVLLLLTLCMAVGSLPVSGVFASAGTVADVAVPVKRADNNSQFKGYPIGAPENMYDEDPSSCSGDAYNTNLSFDFFFDGEAELNYLYLEKKNEGATTDPAGTFGTFGLYVPDGKGGFRKLPDTVPVYNYDTVGGGFLIKLSQPVKTEQLRVKYESWYGELTCWAGISSFRAWTTLNTHTVTFRYDDGKTVSYLVRDGGGISGTKFPMPPEKEGYSARWSAEELTDIREDVVLTPVYNEVKIAYRAGDMTGDGIVSVRDVSRLLCFLSENSTAVRASADVNNDGSKSIEDVYTLLKLLMGSRTVTFDEETLYDKLVGGWIGQMVGVTWAAPTEFCYAARLMPASSMPVWKPQTINDAFGQDDLYVEIPFLDAMKEKGVDCDVNHIAKKFRDSQFGLWHANMMGRFNLKNGIAYPDSGHYLYNYHAEDIDWQIECDFLGMMYPGLPNEAAAKAYELGHIMNYGDGVYGGVFVTAMHAAAYTASSIEEIWQAGIDSIPEGTEFRELLDDVVASYRAGDSFEENWGKIQKKWGSTDICEELPGNSNIDAKLNSGYVLLGLLYGEGDFAKTILLSTRCGQDSDCNPSTAASVLGSFYGASGLPEIYTSGLDKNGRKFSYTNYTFNDAMELNYTLMEKILQKFGGVKEGKNWRYSVTDVSVPAPFEQVPDGAYVYIAPLTVENNTVVFHEVTPFCKNDELKTFTVSMGDGGNGKDETVFKDVIPGRFAYEKAGTYTITFEMTGEKNGSFKTERKVTVRDGGEVPAYTLICNVTGPSGGGSKNIGVIADGITPDRNGGDLQQYDTYMLKDPNGNPDLSTYIGYVYGTEQTVSEVVFTEGKHFGNGGWFKNGNIWIEVFKDGKWTKVETTTDKKYPVANSKEAFGDNFESYVFTLKTPVSCGGVRLAGVAGGSSSFISVGELTVR